MDKSVPSITIKLYPLTLAGIVLLGTLTLGSLGWFWYQMRPIRYNEPSQVQTTYPLPDPFAAPTPADGQIWSRPILEPSTNPALTVTVDTPPETPAIPADTRQAQSTPKSPQPTVADPTEAIALFRVGNQSQHPVRIALLKRASDSTSEAGEVPLPDSVSGAPDQTETPVHWDFEPGEGSYQGLILSLPDQDLYLSDGDVLVAFAQDGSRRYWGPYVVNETPLPYWNAERSEWQLLLQP